MIAQFYQAPSWFFGDENKPSLETFNDLAFKFDVGKSRLLEWSLKKIKLQALFPNNTDNKNPYNNLFTINLISFDKNPWNTLYYKVDNVEVVQENQNYWVTVIFEASIDYYLSFLMPFFSENPTIDYNNMVFFRRKHLNRYIYQYNDGTTYNCTQYTNQPVNCYLDFKHQFWLHTIDKELLDLKNNKTVSSFSKTAQWISKVHSSGVPPDTWAIYQFYINDPKPSQIWVQWWQKSGTFPQQYSYQMDTNWNFATNQTYGQLYLYVVGNMSGETIKANGVLSFSGTEKAAWLPTFNWLNPIWNTQNFWNTFFTFNGNYTPFVMGGSEGMQFGTTLPNIWVNYPKQIYQDILALPFCWTEFIYESPTKLDSQTAEFQTPLSNFLALYKFIKNEGSDSKGYSDYNSGYGWDSMCAMYPGSQSYFSSRYFYGKDGEAGEYWTSDFNGQLLLYQQNPEPMLFNRLFYKWLVKFGNTQSEIYLDEFKNITINSSPNLDIGEFIKYNSFLQTITSFKLCWNYPNTNFTNCNPIELNKIWGTMKYSCFPAINYFYDSNNQVFMNMEWRNTIASLSNNWTNFLEQNHNQYLLGRNMSIVNMATTGLSMGLSAAQSGLSFENPAIAVGEASKTVGSAGSLADQILEYKYKYEGGMSADKGRTPDIKAAGSLNALINNNMAVSFIEEHLLTGNIDFISQHYAKNGYILNRWEPFYFWLNRKYVNFVSIEQFADVMLPNLNFETKKEINNIMRKGIRIWNVINFQNVPNTGGLIWNNITGYPYNPEIFQGNSEVLFLNNGNIND